MIAIHGPCNLLRGDFRLQSAHVHDLIHDRGGPATTTRHGQRFGSERWVVVSRILDVEPPQAPSFVVLQTALPFTARSRADYVSFPRGLARVSLGPHADDREAKISQLPVLSTRSTRNHRKPLLDSGLFDCAFAFFQSLVFEAFELLQGCDESGLRFY